MMTNGERAVWAAEFVRVLGRMLEAPPNDLGDHESFELWKRACERAAITCAASAVTRMHRAHFNVDANVGDDTARMLRDMLEGT